MISGLRTWETWTQMEGRNRDGHNKAFFTALRICRTDGIDRVKLEEIHMAEFAGEVERFLDATAEALGGDRDGLLYFIQRNTVQWRERTYGVITARLRETEVTVPYRRPVLDYLAKP